MNILNELTIKSLKRNKKRTVVTIFGIMLSVALITAITTFLSSMQESLVDYARRQSGEYHLIVSEVPVEKQKYLLKNEKVKSAMMFQTIGEADYDSLEQKREDIEGENEELPQIKVRAMDTALFPKMGIHLLSGRLPQNEEEIVVPVHFSGIVNGEIKEGDILHLKVNGIEKEYTVSGTIGVPDMEFRTPSGEWGHTLFTKLDHTLKGETADIALIMKNPKDTYTFSEELKEEYGFSNGQIQANQLLLQFQGVVKSANVMESLNRLAALVIVVIVITSVFVIKNSFDISITERMKQYGMLASVGATSKQIRKNVLFEGVFLGVIAVPLGILLGVAAIGVTLFVVGRILSGTLLGEELALTLHVSVMAIIAAAVIAVITIFLSALIPARKAAKISPIEAIRESKATVLKGKKLRTSKVLGKLLGIEGELAAKSLKRSRKKYRTTVFSIFLSVVLFLSISSVIVYGFALQNLQYKEMDWNLIAFYEGENQTEAIDVAKEVLHSEGVRDGSVVRRLPGMITNVSYTEEAEKYMGIESWTQEEKDEYATVSFYAVSDEKYREYLKELGVSYEEAKDKGILYDTRTDYVMEEGQKDGKYAEYQLLSIKPKEMLTYQEISQEENGTGEKGEIKILKRADQPPFGVSDNTGEPIVIVSEEWLNQKEHEVMGNTELCIDAKDTTVVKEKIEQLGGEHWNFTDFSEIAKENNSMFLVASIFLYGFIAVISAIGITNVFNTITTNMTLRSREFAVLKSIGMTEKEFRKMIRYESILYGTKALLFGIPVGLALSYLFYKQFINILEMPYHMPWIEMGISVVFVFLIVFLTMEYAVRKTKKQNIIETIRSENI